MIPPLTWHGRPALVAAPRRSPPTPNTPPPPFVYNPPITPQSLPSSPPAETDHHSAIPFDLPCSNCRYNLRTLHPDASCPECGQSISQTYLFYTHKNARKLFDPRPLSRRSPAAAKAVFQASLFAVLSTLAALPLILTPFRYLDDRLQELDATSRYSLQSAQILSIIAAALCLWNYGSPALHDSRKVAFAFRVAAVAYLLFYVSITLDTTIHTHGDEFLHRSAFFLSITTAFLTFLGSALLAAYASWFLRRQRGKHALLGWLMLLFCLPSCLFYLSITLSIDSAGFIFSPFTRPGSFPLVTGIWPSPTSDVITQLQSGPASSNDNIAPLLALFPLSQLLILTAHLRLLLLARSALRSQHPPSPPLGAENTRPDPAP